MSIKTYASQEYVDNAINNIKIPEGSSIELDTTLTEAGKAADAAAVGEALKNINVDGFISYSEAQTLTDEQKAQARANISKYDERLVELQFSGANKYIVLNSTTGQNAINWEIADTVASTAEYGEGYTAFQYIADLVLATGLPNDEYLLSMLKEIKADFTALINAGALTTKKIIVYRESDTSWQKTFAINGEGSSIFIVSRYYDDGGYVTITTDASVETLKTYARYRDGIDFTLSKSAYYADAKATGDAIKNLSDSLSAVATSGSYNDLEDKPEIPNIDNFATTAYVDEKFASVGDSMLIYKQNEEPVDAEENALWIDLDAECAGASSGGNVDEERIDQAVADYLAQNPVSGGMTKTEKNLILQLFRNAAYTSGSMGNTLSQLETLWSGSGDVHSHSYTSTITTAATCTTAGVRTYTCNCGHSYTQTIPATGHNYVNGVCTVCGAVDPTYNPGTEPDVPVEPEVTLFSISATYSGGDVAVGTAVTDLTGIVVTAHYSDGTSEPVTGYTLSGTIAEGSNTITVNYGGKTTTFTVTGVAVAEAELLTDGLLGYWDLRNPAEVVAKDWHWAYPSNEGTGGLYASFIGGSKGSASIPTFGEHGTASEFYVMPDDTTYPAVNSCVACGTEFTVVAVSKGNIIAQGYTHGHFGVSSWNFEPKWQFRGYYNTSSGASDTDGLGSGNNDSISDYNFLVERVNGSEMKVIMDTSSMEFDGASYDGFVSWYDKMAKIKSLSGTVVAIAIYGRVLTDVEIEQMRAFMKTLEVN